jgi:ElaA protein
MHFKCHPVSDPRELQECRAIRHAAFVDELHVPEAVETEGEDDPSLRHFAVTNDGRIIGTCRVRVQGSAAKIERMAVLKDLRHKGAGQVLLKYLLQELPRGGDIQLLKVSAQSDTVPFYEIFGFRPRGSEYMEAGMPHYAMVRET